MIYTNINPKLFNIQKYTFGSTEAEVTNAFLCDRHQKFSKILTQKWKDFDALYAGSNELWLAEVSIWNEYEEYVYDADKANDVLLSDANRSLFAKYRIKAANIPQFRLFLKNRDTIAPIIYYKSRREVKGTELIDFVRQNGVALALNGCLAELDALVHKFMLISVADKRKREKLIEDANVLLLEYGDKKDELKSAQYYIEIMDQMTSK